MGGFGEFEEGGRVEVARVCEGTCEFESVKDGGEQHDCILFDARLG